MRRALLASVVATLLLGGCAPVRLSPAAAPPSRAPEPLSAPGGTASPIGVDTSLAVRPSDSPRAVLIDDDGTGKALRARPIDPKTLTDLPGYPPIAFGHHYRAEVSPDGRTIAAIMWPTGSSNYGPMVHLIDTVTWTDRALDITLHGPTSALRFDQSGRRLFWARAVHTESTPSLFGLDIASGVAREIARLPDGFYVRDLEVFGTRAVLSLMPWTFSQGVKGPREVLTIAVIDIDTPKTTLVRVPAIRAGQYQDGNPESEPWRMIEPGFAWDLPRARLFVADAESDRVFGIDLGTGELRGPFEPKPRRSMLDVFWSLLSSVADAKMTSATRQHAAVSPDGTRLFVSGLRSDFAQGTDGKYHETVTPLQLRIIDTGDMSELARLDAATTPLWMSPDGASLVYGSNRFDPAVEGYATRSDFNMRLLDTIAGREVATIPIAGDPWLLAFTRASPTAYVRVQHYNAGTLGFASLSLIDLVTHRVVASRDMDRHVAEVLLLEAR